MRTQRVAKFQYPKPDPTGLLTPQVFDECLEGVRRLVESDFTGPVNIGSEEMVTINQLTEMIMEIAGKRLRIKHVEGPQGVRGRNSDNRLILKKLGWEPKIKLRDGLEITYKWINQQGINSRIKD